MYKLFNTIKDTTLYKQQPTQNIGLDEVLEISKTYYGSLLDVARPLLQFNQTELTASLGGLTIGEANLVLRECESQEVPLEYTVYAYPVSQSWDMGIGTRFDDITSEGATWSWPSLNSTTWSLDGGDYLTSPSGSVDIQYLGSDLEIPMDDILAGWMDASIPNNGVILKLSDDAESGSIDYGILQYFGKETNTIYQPKLRVGYDDSSFDIGTGSLQLMPLDSDDIHVTFKRLRSKYKLGSTVKIIVVGREKYPLKQYTKLYSYTDIQYLPTTTWYQVKDAQTDEIIIPFSDYSKVSCDSNGNYFNINFANWEYNRDYYLEIKTEINGSEYYFSEDNLVFTIEQ